MPEYQSFPTVNAHEGDRESNAFKYDHLINGISRTKPLTIKEIMRVIIRHLGREVRAIRDLLITCLSIKEGSENITSTQTVILYWFDLLIISHTHRFVVSVWVTLLSRS